MLTIESIVNPAVSIRCPYTTKRHSNRELSEKTSKKDSLSLCFSIGYQDTDKAQEEEQATIMAKLYFRYGTVGSAKTLNLLAVAHSYTQQGKKVVVMKPALDTRFGKRLVKSRAGLEREADLLIEEDTVLKYCDFNNINCILVDEAQFLGPQFVSQLRALSIDLDIPVICYGLRSDFKRNLFKGSQRLLELADEISEIKTTCFFCDKRALFNLKFKNGVPTLEGPSVELGSEEKYLPACSRCYAERLEIGVSSDRNKTAYPRAMAVGQ